MENPLFRFVLFRAGQQPAVPKTSIKEQFLSLWVSRGGEWLYRASRDHSFLLSRQAGGGCPRAPLLPICGTG